MKKFGLRKAIVPLIAVMIIASCATRPAVVSEQLDTPGSVVLNRGHIESLSFGGPMGLSWDEVDNRATFSVLVFRNSSSTNPAEAFARVDGIDALYVNIDTAFGDALRDGPFWFRVQAVAGGIAGSALSEPRGPFWYAYHSDEFTDTPLGSLAIFTNPAIPVLVLDSRMPHERANQGNIEGDFFVNWPNAVAVEAGVTHADFQEGVLAAWETFVTNNLTNAQRANLDPLLGYRDIHIFIY